MPSQSPNPSPSHHRRREGASSFSIDEFIVEIEKAEDIKASKPLYAERMRNKRALDRAERRAHEAAGTTGELVARPLKSRRSEDEAADEANGSPQMAAEETSSRPASREAEESQEVRSLRRHRHAAQGAQIQGQRRRAPRLRRIRRARPGRLRPRALRHRPAIASPPATSAAPPPKTRRSWRRCATRSRPRRTPRRQAKVKTPGTSTRKSVKLPGQNLDGAQTVGISATVRALEDIILHGRKEVEGNTAWQPHRPARPDKIRRRHPLPPRDHDDPGRRPADRDRRSRRGRQQRRDRPGPPRRHRLGQDLHDGAGDLRAPTALP